MDLSQDTYNIIYILTAIVNLILLICFFYLVRNVWQIKKKLLGKGTSTDYSLEQYYKYRASNQRDKAASALHDYFWEKTRLHQYCYTASLIPDKHNPSYQMAISSYGSLFEAINEPLPEPAFDKRK